MFMTSIDNILYDEYLKKKLKIEFTSKLGRRSFFTFVDEDVIQPEYTSINEMLKADREREDKAITNNKKASLFLQDNTNNLINSSEEVVTISNEVRDLFYLYKNYNELTSENISIQFQISKLSRAHLQWKALKLAGALALLDSSFEIKKEHYIAAIRYTELVNNDVTVFEKELVKESYEIFADYMHKLSENGKATITLHNLRKLGYIPVKGSPQQKVKELIQLVSSYDQTGVYALSGDTIEFTKLVKTDVIGVSYKQVSGSKMQRAKQCSSGFTYELRKFAELPKLLSGDFAYSPFEFINNHRSKETTGKTCKWIALDIDSSLITDIEAHQLLSDINHHIVRSSDATNSFKFRVLLELDAEVEVSDTKWKKFTKLISEDLGLIPDGLPKSQIFFSYSKSYSSLLSTLDGEPLNVKPYLDMLATVDEIIKPLTTNKKKEMLIDPFTTFQPAYEAKSGEGSRKLIWAIRTAKELGANKEEIVSLVHSINDYWVVPMESERLQMTVLNQVDRLFE